MSGDESPDAILQLRLVLILASPFFCAVLLFSYFGKVLKDNKWRLPVYILSVPFGLMVLSVLALVFLIGILSPHRALTVEQLEG